MVITMSLVFSGCSFVKKNPQADNQTIVAVVGGEQIMKTEFTQRFETLKVQYEQQYGAKIWDQDVDGRKYIDVIKEKVLDMLVDIKVQEKEAIKSGITATDEEIGVEVEKARAYFDTEAKFNEFLTTQKMTIEYLKDSIRKDILVNKLQEKLTTGTTVSDEEVAAYYGANQDQFISIKVSHILIENEDEAKRVLERVKAGENINELAPLYSIDPSAKENKGVIDYFRKGQMVQAFETAAFALKPGEISDLVKTDYGFHIIKLEDKKFDKLEDIAAELKTSMIKDKKDKAYQGLLEEMKTKADIKKYPKNL
ncbi:MAG: peptidylprolyl isomerase [Clostridia bacterium]|nr:peptidylprolyl isomerase [Clostridia bacterium]